MGFIDLLFREKVDLTQYIEEHLFAFDQVFDDLVTNEQVRLHNG